MKKHSETRSQQLPTRNWTPGRRISALYATSGFRGGGWGVARCAHSCTQTL